ncbi:MAG: NAD+ synthase [Balneolaceae bacterium]|nr:NAD+ synthase [Balneolaceae bacterium]
MRIRAAQLNVRVGDLAGNVERILQAWDRAEQDAVELLLLPELVTTGYPPMDMLDHPWFALEVEHVHKALQEASAKKSCALVFGTITRRPPEDPGKPLPGKPLYNSALWIHQGKEVARVHKQLLPTYDVFDEARYFEPGPLAESVKWGGHRFGVLICEDLFENENPWPASNYAYSPVENLQKKGVECVLIPSASPFTLQKKALRRTATQRVTNHLGCPLALANQVGGNTELLFDGGSFVSNHLGDLMGEASSFQEGWADGRFPTVGSKTMDSAAEPPRKTLPTQSTPWQEQALQAITLGIRDYSRKSELKPSICFGLSGGIDSALIAVLAAHAVGPENVMAIGMPTQYSSEGSLTDSKDLAERLGIGWKTCSIEQMRELAGSSLEAIVEEPVSEIARENIQSRLRGLTLMALSNHSGALLLATSNKSEMAVGYSTLYGDMAGALAPIGDLYKTQVYELASWLNQYGPYPGAIPESIFTKPPSAELKPDQVDQDSLPDYSVLDRILERMIEYGDDVKGCIERGFHEETSIWVFKQLHRMEFKRFQSSPVLKLQSRTFGLGRRWPLAHQFTTI